MKPKFRSLIAAFAPLQRSSLIVCASLCAATSAHADRTWSGTSSADWNTAANWSGAVPGAGDVAIFNSTSLLNLATTASADSPMAGIRVVDPPAAVGATSANSMPATFAAVTPDFNTDIFTYTALPATPLTNGDRVTFTVTTLPAGLTAGATYFVVNATATTFKISLTAGGAAVDFTANGAGVNVNGVLLANNLTDTFTYSSSFYAPFSNGSWVTFGAQTTPTGLIQGMPYFVTNATATTFQVSTTKGGTALDFTTDGLSVRAGANNQSQFSVGASGINLSLATQNLTLSLPVIPTAAQTWNVAAGRILSVPGVYLGTGGPVTFAGLGATTFTGPNGVSTGGLVIGNGATVNMNGPSFGSVLGNNVSNAGTITFDGGSLSSTAVAGNTMVFHNPVFVDTGRTGTINFSVRTNWGGTGSLPALTGNGTLNFRLGTNVSRNDVFANMSGFTGTLSIESTVAGATERYFASSGASMPTNGTVDIGSGATTVFFSPQTNSGGNTVLIGALTGGVNGTLGGGTAGAPNYNVGALGTDTTFGGSITGNAVLTKTGTGILTLTNPTGLTYTGATTVTEGSLKINGVKSGVGATTINGTTTTGRLTGTGSVAGTTTVAVGGHLAPGDDLVAGGIGNITHSSLTLAGGSFVDLEFSGGNDTVTVATGGTLTLSPGVKINAYDGTEANAVSFGTNGTYPIINVTGATVSGFNSSTFVVENGVPGKVYSFTQSPTAISMVVSATDPNNYWAVNGSSTWNLAANWTKNLVPNTAGAIAKVGPGPGGAGGSFSGNPTIALDGNRTVGELTLNDDFGATITISPGLVTPGTLLMDNGPIPAGIVSIAGAHLISAPVSVDAQGVAVDVAAVTLTMQGVISGPAASLTKAGAGTLALTGNNTYAGGTILNNGVTSINSATSLGAIAGAVTFAGGTLQIANDLAGITRNSQVAGANNAIFDTNGFAFGYAGVISPAAGGTGGLTKIGGGALTLSAPQTYTGTTSVTAGTLGLAAGGSTNGGATNVSGGGAILSVTGGSLTASALSSVANSAAIAVSSGSVAFNAGLNANTSNPSSNIFINLTGGTFSSTFLAMGRSAGTITVPTAGSTTAGLYINGAAATITGNLSLGTSSNTNSSTSARIDSGSLTVGGATFIQVNSPDRWSVFDVNGGTVTSTDTVTGVQIGSGLTGNNVFLVRAGTATVERFLLTQPAASLLTSRLSVSGGTLYVGAGGIVGNNNGGAGVLDVELRTATLGAKASWSTLLGATLNGTTTVRAADVADIGHDITLSGILSGTGGIEKTGGGTLTLSGANTYAGTTAVTVGKLAITGDNSGAAGEVSVASGATLGGNGNIGGNVTVATGGRQEFSVAANPTAQNLVKRVITGTLTLNSGTFLDLTAAGPVASGVYTLATASSIVGTGNVPIKGNVNGLNATVSVSGNSLIVTIVASDFDTWISGFTFAPGANLTTTGDPDGDGLTNLQEYAFGLNPSLGSSVSPITTQLSKTTGLFTYTRRRTTLTGMTYVYEYSTSLGSWTSFTPDSAISNNGNPVESITVDVPNALLTNTNLFVRVRAVK